MRRRYFLARKNPFGRTVPSSSYRRKTSSILFSGGLSVVLSCVVRLVHETVALSLPRRRSQVPRRFPAGSTPASHEVRQHSEVSVAALRLPLSRLPSARFLRKSPLDLAHSPLVRPRPRRLPPQLPATPDSCGFSSARH